MTGSDQLDRARPRGGSPTCTRGAARPSLSVRGLRLRAGRPADRRRDPRRRARRRWPGSRGTARTSSSTALRGADPTSAARSSATPTARRRSFATPKQAADNGIAYVPRERRQALFGWMSIRENFAHAHAGTRQHAPACSAARPRASAWPTTSTELGIVLGRPDDAITTLSGGNQQKVVIARWLAAGPRVLLLNDPDARHRRRREARPLRAAHARWPTRAWRS